MTPKKKTKKEKSFEQLERERRETILEINNGVPIEDFYDYPPKRVL